MTDPKTLKNNTERKEWLNNYQDWGIWYTDEHIGATYYKYDFENGAQLIAVEFTFPGIDGYLEPLPGRFYHLIGGPKVEGFIDMYHEWFNPYYDSERSIRDWLKATKGGSTDGR